MKKLIAVFVLSLMSMSVSFAGENPKLFKEIKRKLTLDLSKIDLSKEKSVTVEFKIVNQEIEILKISGSEELQEIMVKELEEMFIKSDSECDTIHQYKFSFSNE